ncbi:MAG: DUF4007 family protein [Chloroflexus sp.]|uniref:DUF4007 family protein n=1 Tax=Chloroflexus sp. TaxID=1904827 RepID=UPI0030A3FCF2
MSTHLLDTISFSGHETFTLRSNWLKKAFDLLCATPDLFHHHDAFVRLGVGKNMSQSIRFWGIATGLFKKTDKGNLEPTDLGKALLADDGWDPFLVTSTSRWLIHYQISSRPNSTFTWYYTFNLLKRGEFTIASLAKQLSDHLVQIEKKLPSEATLERDIDCMLRCYIRPSAYQSLSVTEDALHCPLNTLHLIQRFPDQSGYYLASGSQPSLPDALVAFSALQQARWLRRHTLTFNEIAYGERSPGRIFRLDEDSLLSRLFQFEEITNGQATYSDSGGIRQIMWRTLDDPELDWSLLRTAFISEPSYA